MQEVPFEPYVISPLSVAENKGSGKKRLIFDLSQLNFFVDFNRREKSNLKIGMSRFISLIKTVSCLNLT